MPLHHRWKAPRSLLPRAHGQEGREGGRGREGGACGGAWGRGQKEHNARCPSPPAVVWRSKGERVAAEGVRKRLRE